MTTRSADRVLIANRGEIALRVVRTVRDLGGTSILPYTPEDLLSPAAELADEAHALPEGSSYTDAAAILDLARRTGADAIHPGYGFLSEHADFARAVMDAGITWVGPSPEAMEALGDKMSARATAERAGVAPVPGITDSVTGPDAVIDFASAHGYPVALKRTDGGGGRGITVLASEEEVRATPAFEAAAAGGGALILERFVTAARHIETQCARDRHGAFAVVSTRDCTLQRRNQKLLEEAPAPYLPEGVHACVRTPRSGKLNRIAEDAAEHFLQDVLHGINRRSLPLKATIRRAVISNFERDVARTRPHFFLVFALHGNILIEVRKRDRRVPPQRPTIRSRA